MDLPHGGSSHHDDQGKSRDWAGAETPVPFISALLLGAHLAFIEGWGFDDGG